MLLKTALALRLNLIQRPPNDRNLQVMSFQAKRSLQWNEMGKYIWHYWSCAVVWIVVEPKKPLRPVFVVILAKNHNSSSNCSSLWRRLKMGASHPAKIWIWIMIKPFTNASDPPKKKKLQIYETCTDVISVLYVLTCATRLLVYILCNKEIRSAITETLCCCRERYAKFCDDHPPK